MTGSGRHLLIPCGPWLMARRLGSGLLREAMALRGRMTPAGYDWLFPSQDLLPAGAWGT
jgi:hypothetical protein